MLLGVPPHIHKLKACSFDKCSGQGARRQSNSQEQSCFNCDKCDEAVPPLRLHPVKAPPRYTFNHEVLVDALVRRRTQKENGISSLSIVCNGSLFHTVAVVRPGGGTPSSRKCAAKFSASQVRQESGIGLRRGVGEENTSTHSVRELKHNPSTTCFRSLLY